MMESLIAEAARGENTDLSLVSVDSTAARARHGAAGMRIDSDVMDALAKAAAEQGRARQKGAAPGGTTGRKRETTPDGRNGAIFDAGAGSA